MSISDTQLFHTGLPLIMKAVTGGTFSSRDSEGSEPTVPHPQLHGTKGGYGSTEEDILIKEAILGLARDLALEGFPGV